MLYHLHDVQQLECPTQYYATVISNCLWQVCLGLHAHVRVPRISARGLGRLHIAMHCTQFLCMYPIHACTCDRTTFTNLLNCKLTKWQRCTASNYLSLVSKMLVYFNGQMLSPSQTEPLAEHFKSCAVCIHPFTLTSQRSLSRIRR